MPPIHSGDSDSSSRSPEATAAALPGDPIGPTSGTRACERRRAGRHPHRLSVKLLTSPAGYSASYVGLTENLSENGAFVATRAPWTIGCTIDLIIGLPHQPILRARARVCWRRTASSETGCTPGIGIRFERLSASDAARIREFAKS